MPIADEAEFEVKIWIKNFDARKVFIRAALKAMPAVFIIVFGYLLYQYAALSIGFFKGSTTGISFFIPLIFLMALPVSILYAVGSGFEKVAELEKANQKTRIIFRQSEIVFIRNLNCAEKSWTDFEKVKETVDGFRLYPKHEKSFFINHCELKSKQNIYQLREFARANLGERAKLKND